MNKMMRRKSFASALAASSLFALVATVPRAVAVPLSKVVKVKVETTQANYAKGADVHFAVTAKNTSDKTVTLKFSSSQTFDFLVSSKTNKLVVWQWSKGRLFIAQPKQMILAPGDKVTLHGRWNQKNNAGNVVPSGQYTVVGRVTTQGSGLSSEAADFKIKKN